MDHSEPPTAEFERARVAEVIAEVRARRARGEALSDEAVLGAHPELRAGLAIELRKLALIQEARKLADVPYGHATILLGRGAESAELPLIDWIAGYEILDEIQRGSQGVVYRAVQKSTRREVALKVIREGPLAGAADRRRFDREVQALSALKHPNIVSIHDSGVAAGRSYFVMDYIDGKPLDEYVAAARPSIDGLLRLFVKICDAVAAAQIRGIIHRDLKPGNIRIDQTGEPHVLDFGLAKIDPSAAASAGGPRSRPIGEAALRLDAGPDQAFTQTGQFLGSLPWASPEQADGSADDIDVRTDVYSLGVVLYQALTGQFPYKVSGSFHAVLDNILHAAPTRPSDLRREINDEIETILLKCLQKPRERRYQSAGELSADVQRYLRCEPIDAKRDSYLYVLRKQARRYWVPFGATVAVIVSLIAGIIGTSRATLRALRAESDALALAQAESQARVHADWELYKACLSAADAALRVNDATAAEARLSAAPVRLRGWEWRYLHSRLDQSLGTFKVDGMVIHRVLATRDGRRVLVATNKGALLEIDPRTGQSKVLSDDAAAGATAVALSLHGERIAFGLLGGEMRVCDGRDGRELTRFRAHSGGEVSALAISPNGALLATGRWTAQDDKRVQVWGVATGQVVRTIEVREGWVSSLTFTNDGNALASTHFKPNAGVRLSSVADGRLMFAIDYGGFDVSQLEFSPDGGQFAVASQDSVIRLYETATGREVQSFTGHMARLNHVAFSADGRRLASLSLDQSLRVWDLATGAVQSTRRGQAPGPGQVVFLPDDDGLLTLSLGPSLFQRWDLQTIEEPRTFDCGKYFVLFCAFSEDGRRLYSHQRCWDATTGRELARLSPRLNWEHTGWIGSEEDFESVTDGNGDSALLFRDEPVGDLTEPLLFRPIPAPRGARVAIGLKRGVIQVYQADEGRKLGEYPIDAENAGGAHFSGDGERLVVWDDGGSWAVWEIATGRRISGGRQGTLPIVGAALSSDGRLVATASYDETARIYDVQSGKELHVLRAAGAMAGDQSVVWSVAFNPDGTRLATGSKDRRIRLWDVASGRELMTLTRHAGTVMCLAWSADGTQLASGGYEGMICLWDSLSYAERRSRAGAPATTSPR